MASVTFFFDTRRAKAGDKFPLKICVSYGGQRTYLTTGVDLTENQWNGKAVVKCDSRTIYNNYLESLLAKAENAVVSIQCRGISKVSSPGELKTLLERQMSGRFQASTYKVRDAFEAKMNTIAGKSTRSIYAGTLQSMGEYCDLCELTMSDIDYRWLVGYEAFLRSAGNKTNSISIDMRNIRAVFNHLITLGDIEQDCYPFRKYKIKSEATPKRSITVDQLRLIRDWPDGPLKRYADIFMLIFYLRGINIVDLCNLREITPEGRIVYKRAKTGRIYSVKVEPEAAAIIEKYRGERYLIDIFDRRKSEDHKSFTSRINKYLKRMLPGLSTYSARHTFATVSADLDVPVETIAAALGHSYGSPTTAIYIRPNQRKIDEANRRVIDYVNQDLIK